MMGYDIAIIGAGISGLTTAAALFEKGVQNVLVVDYQEERGGFAAPFHQMASYTQEREMVQKSHTLPYEVWTKATVIGFFPGERGEAHQIYVQTVTGTKTVEAKIVVIASGALEKPREAHRIAGTRPAGVMTPSMVAQLLQRGFVPGEKIALLDTGRMTKGVAELVADQEVELYVFDSDEWEVVEIVGRARLTEVRLQHRANQERLSQPCDTLIYSRGRIPSSFFLKGTPVKRDESHAILIDEKGRTNVERVFATGSCTCLGDDEHLVSIGLARNMVPELLKSLK